jgi:phosphoribosyl-dephospho-CoA transferase
MRIHDLLEVDVSRFPQAAPQWVAERLRRTPFVVVRRGNATDDDIPVGVRGAHRSERWATSCHPSLVRRTVTPEELLDLTIPDRMPALRALRLLKERWGRNWGPGGSVGFELATGEPVVTLESDLDAVIYAREPIDLGEARALLAATRDLPAAVDVRVETPRVGFSLAEYVQGTRLLLRTPHGAVLGTDPWSL